MVATQLFIGTTHIRSLTHQSLAEAITRHCSTSAARRLMIWNAGPSEWCSTAVTAATDAGVEPWLWYPVLADNPVLHQEGCATCVPGCAAQSDDNGGGWLGGAPDEDFRFHCPNHGRTVALLADDLHRTIQRWPWAGVFFDRIRYPSPANGLPYLATCFCETCVRRMQEAGIDVSALRSRLAGVPQTVPHTVTDANGISPVAAQKFLVATNDLAGWTDFRADSIEKMLVPLVRVARDADLGVGLDLYSPSLALLVGQDYQRLAPHADWIKPMSYFRAPGPAGFPVENAFLAEGLEYYFDRKGGNIDADAPALAASAAAALTGFDAPAVEETGERIVAEVTLAEQRVHGCAAAVFPGVELVHLPEAGITTNAATAETILRPVRAHSEHLSVSWNLLSIPDSVAQVVGALYG
jgi:hypothetical protein